MTEPSLRAEAAAHLSVPIALAGEHERGEVLIKDALRELGSSPQFVFHRQFCLLRGSRVAREAGNGQLGIERVLEAQRLVREAGPTSPLTELNLAMELAEAYRMAGNNQQAASAFAEAFKQLSALGRDDTERAGTLLNNWALAVDGLGRPLEAEPLFQRAITISRTEGQAETVSPMLLINIARSLGELFRFAEAAEFAERAAELAEQAGNEHVMNMSFNVRATLYRQQGDLVRAADMIAALEAKSKTLLPTGHVAFAVIAMQRSQLALACGNAAEALLEADRALTLAEARPEARERLPMMLVRRAEVKMRLQRLDGAKTDVTRALSLLRETIGPDLHSSWNGRAHLTMARLLRAQGNPGQARVAYASALEHLLPSLGEDHPETREAADGGSNP
jgi:tetratricopeptide (TPR) repeat protein